MSGNLFNDPRTINLDRSGPGNNGNEASSLVTVSCHTKDTRFCRRWGLNLLQRIQSAYSPDFRLTHNDAFIYTNIHICS